jgi:hypothetical protein
MVLLCRLLLVFHVVLLILACAILGIAYATLPRGTSSAGHREALRFAIAASSAVSLLFGLALMATKKGPSERIWLAATTIVAPVILMFTI